MNEQKGFTIIELIVVIAIIAVLASIVLVNVNGYISKARDAKRIANIEQIRIALEMYYVDNGNYPLSNGASLPSSNWSNSNDSSWDDLQAALQQYLSKLPQDPKQNSSGWPGAGQYSYAYYSRDFGCNQQWYMLVYKPENSNFTSPGVKTCDGTNFNYSGTVTIGVGR